MRSSRASFRRVVIVATLVVLLAPAPRADASARQFMDGLLRRTAEVRARVHQGWQIQRETRHLAALQRRAVEEARAEQERLEQQALAQARPPGRMSGPAGNSPPADGLLTGPERAMLASINEHRAAAGLAPVVPDAALVASARAHSEEMAGAARVYHTPRLLSVLPRPRGRTLSENVGVGQSVDSLQRTFMSSKSHRGAILGRSDRVGLGVVVSPGRTWVTQYFMRTR